MNIQSNSKNVDTDGTNAAEPERKEPAEKEETADEADFVSGVGEVSEEEPRQEGKIKKNKHESVIFRRDNSHYEKLDGVERCIDDELPFPLYVFAEKLKKFSAF